MEKWTKWIPLTEIPAVLYPESICDTKKGLVITFKDEKKQLINFTFDGTLLSYRNTEEGVFLKTLSYLQQHYDSSFYNSWALFKVQNSDYLKWFKQESLGAYEDQHIEHYVFYTADVVTEVLSFYPPDVFINIIK